MLSRTPEHDVNVKGIVAFLVILAVTLLVVYGVIGTMWRHLESDAQRTDARILAEGSTLTARENRPYFPAPREQPAPQVDLDALRAREDRELTTYGWVDRSNGIVRIPIDRAMQLVLQNPEVHP
jgi:hypothetical protein